MHPSIRSVIKSIFLCLDFTGSKHENVSIQTQPVTVLPMVNTSLMTEYNTDYYRNNNRRVTRRPVTRRPVVRRPTNNRRPPQNKASINWDQSGIHLSS